MEATISPRSALTIPEGGTGAQTASQALFNLQVPMGTIEAVSPIPPLTQGGDLGIIQIGLGVVPLNLGGTGASTQLNARNALGAAPLIGPVFTGAARSTGALLAGDSSDRIATTQWVQNELTAFTPPTGVIDGGTF